jgi:hypothetical protein
MRQFAAQHVPGAGQPGLDCTFRQMEGFRSSGHVHFVKVIQQYGVAVFLGERQRVPALLSDCT